MATVHEIEQRLFSWAPRESAMDWDNVGHLVGDPEQEVERILVALDITERVVQEAIDCGAQLIVSHHPVMNVRWHEREMQTLRPDTRLGGVLTTLVKNDISAICMHTNLDAADGDVIELLGCGGLRYCRGSGRVHRVAVGGGACGEYIPQAIAQGCDTFVTSDLRYNDFLDTRGLNLIDAGHFPTENIVCPTVKAYLEEHFPEVKTVISTSHRDVIQYYL